MQLVEDLVSGLSGDLISAKSVRRGSESSSFLCLTGFVAFIGFCAIRTSRGKVITACDSASNAVLCWFSKWRFTF